MCLLQVVFIINQFYFYKKYMKKIIVLFAICAIFLSFTPTNAQAYTINELSTKLDSMQKQITEILSRLSLIESRITKFEIGNISIKPKTQPTSCTPTTKPTSNTSNKCHNVTWGNNGDCWVTFYDDNGTITGSSHGTQTPTNNTSNNTSNPGCFIFGDGVYVN